LASHMASAFTTASASSGSADSVFTPTQPVTYVTVPQHA
jgi:hypothetical protein